MIVNVTLQNGYELWRKPAMRQCPVFNRNMDYIHSVRALKRQDNLELSNRKFYDDLEKVGAEPRKLTADPEKVPTEPEIVAADPEN